MTEPTPTTAPGRGAWLGFVLGAFACLLAFFLPWQAALPAMALGITAHLGGAALALGHAPEGRALRCLLRRGPCALLAVLAVAAGISALAAAPLWWLLQEASLPAVLLLSLALALAWLGLSRIWPVLALAWVDKPLRRGQLALIRHCLGESRRLVASDPSNGRGLVAALSGLLLLAGSIAWVLWAPGLPLPWMLTVAGVWSLLLAPFLGFLLLALVEPARFAARSRSAAAKPVEQASRPTAPPTLLPGDPTARLLAAARLGRSDDALAALDAGADSHALPASDDRDQRSLAMLAAILPDTRLLRRLIAAGVDLNHRQAGLTALLAATRDSLRGRPDTVMTLLANGANPCAADAEGRTALHFAVLAAEPDVAALLLDAGAPLEALNRDGYSPLGVACAAGNWRLARFLLERKARVDPVGGQPALLGAASGDDDPAGVHLLLRYKAKVDARGRLGRNALHTAALAGNLEIVEALLDAGADVDARDDHGISALLEAARAGANAVLRRLLAARPDASVRDPSGRNALVLACQSARADGETIELLLQLGVDPTQPADDGRAALECAVAHGRWPLVTRLDPLYPVPASLLLAGDHSQLLVAAALDDGRPWQARLDEALASSEPARLVAILRSARPPAAELFEFTLRVADRLDSEHADRLVAALDRDWLEQHPSALRRALHDGHGGLAAALLRRGASAGGGGDLATWLAACRVRGWPDQREETLALHLLEAGADGSGPHQGTPPLVAAAALRWNRLLEALLRRGSDPNADDRSGYSALHRATVHGNGHAVALLLRYGARIDACTSDGCTPYGLALRHRQPDLLDWLQWRGWPWPGRPLREADLVAAAGEGDVAAVQRLLALGLAIEGRDAQGATALLRASGGGHLAVVELLLQRGADPAAAAHSGATCLSAAISRRQRSVVEALLRHGAEVDQPLPGGVTPLMVAAALGLPEMLVMLLDRGADVRCADRSGNAAIHALAQFGFTARDKDRAVACWKALLALPDQADRAGADGLSPLLLLLGARADAGHPVDDDCLGAQLELLLAHPVDLGRRDSRGFSALHLCALHGQLAALRRLLRAGADRDARDGINRRAQEIALMRGFVDLSAELEPQADSPSPPSMARFLRGRGE